VLVIADTIRLSRKNGSGQAPVKLLNRGIAWPSDKEYKFKNPKGEGTLEDSEE
jgi:hypothetical protein